MLYTRSLLRALKIESLVSFICCRPNDFIKSKFLPESVNLSCRQILIDLPFHEKNAKFSGNFHFWSSVVITCFCMVNIVCRYFWHNIHTVLLDYGAAAFGNISAYRFLLLQCKESSYHEYWPPTVFILSFWFFYFRIFIKQCCFSLWKN